MTSALFAERALLPEGWARDVRIAWDAAGNIATVAAGAQAQAGDARAWCVVPGMVNLHSHAFQRAMAGLTEMAGGTEDNFWSWRTLMYRLAGRVTPEQLEAIAAMLYAECLVQGYTAVCEFHYVHHAPDGARYADPAEMSLAAMRGARAAGIGQTLLPVMYRYAGFSEQPLQPGQRRFAGDPAFMAELLERLAPHRDGQFATGLAPHSLRAASLADLREVARATPADMPLHIHVAEQRREVDDCVAHTGRRPVRLLLDEIGLNARWCLVHATHVDAGEVRDMAASGAIAGLCPTTEANLGDGIFPFDAYLAAGGAWGIGSDSHVSQSPIEELRWLEYGQRLRLERRNVAVTASERHVGALLWRQALAGGAKAAGRPVGAIAAGLRADLVALDPDHPALAHASDANRLDALVFAGNTPAVREVIVGGEWRVREARHVDHAAIARRYREATAALIDDA